MKHNEHWEEDSCCVCKVNDTDFLEDACEECTTTWNNWVESNAFAKSCIGKVVRNDFFGYSLD